MSGHKSSEPSLEPEKLRVFSFWVAFQLCLPGVEGALWQPKRGLLIEKQEHS